MSKSNTKGYFRPWSPSHSDNVNDTPREITNMDRIQPSMDRLTTEQPLIGHSQTTQFRCQKSIPVSPPLPSSSYGSHTNVSKENCTTSAKESGIMDHGQMCSNKALMQRLQTDYYSNHQAMKIPVLDQNVHIVKEMPMKPEVMKDQRYCVTAGVLRSPSYRTKDPWCGLKCVQNRDIYSIPRHTLNIGQHSSAFRRIRQSNYPLPSPRDGEPLDLLPKSLYMNKANGGHLCIFCGKLYSRKYGLKIHLRTHTGYKPLRCKICQRPFGDPSNLNKHIRLHAEGETPYRCGKCGKVLVRQRDLDRHIRARHPVDINHMASREQLSSPGYSEDGTSSSSFSSFEIDNMEELDVVGLH